MSKSHAGRSRAQAFAILCRACRRAALRTRRCRAGVTQPLVSRQIRAIEKLLGIQLLQATRPRVELTPAGERLFEDAQQMLQQVERLSRAVQRVVLGRETLSIAFEPCSSFHAGRALPASADVA